jgi:glyoxylase-like metal-dependent hydrolase (beta-lactamase superfamily II)
VLGEELHPGLRRWTAHHEQWGKDVACFAVSTPSETVLIDPLLASGDWANLERAGGRRSLHVLLTIHWHARSAGEIAERFPDARIWAHSRNRAAVARRTPVTDVFRVSDPLPGGLVALEARPRSEVLFWEPRARALIVGDALLGAGEGGDGLHTCPAWWLPQSTSLLDLRSALRPALELPIRMVLPSHGAPVLRGARQELARLAA